MRDEKCSDNTTKGSAATGIYAKCCRMTFWLAFGAFLSVFKVSQKVGFLSDCLYVTFCKGQFLIGALILTLETDHFTFIILVE